MSITITNPQALECRECRTSYPVEPRSICEECFGPLEPSYDLDALSAEELMKQVESGPAALWR